MPYSPFLALFSTAVQCDGEIADKGAKATGIPLKPSQYRFNNKLILKKTCLE